MFRGKIMGNVIIENKDLLLRNVSLDDKYDWLEIFNSEKVAKTLTKISDIDSIVKLIEYKMKKYQTNPGCSLSIVLKEENKCIGNFELKVDESNNSAEISYVFNDKYWGKGYATQVSKMIIKYAFCEFGIKKITADCLEENRASNHILKDKLCMDFLCTEIREQNGIKQKYNLYELKNSA